jgi:CBS domain-containing protein
VKAQMVLSNYPVANSMHKDVETVRPDETLREAVRDVRIARYGCLVAVDGDGRPVGILTGGDLFRLLLSEQIPDAPYLRHIFASPDALLEHLHSVQAAASDRVADCMSTPLVTVEESASLEEVADVFDQRDFNQVPVVRDGRLVGLMLRVDLLDPLLEVHEQLQRERDAGGGNRAS